MMKEKIKPFIKWAGGKTQLLSQINKYLPDKYNRYFEVFVGGGALLFNLMPKKAFINDSNFELISAYSCFRDEIILEKLIEKLKEHENNHSENYYYEIRNMDRNLDFKNLESYEIAARFIYLNKACFNGLYRVNSKGFFNVPFGKKEKIKVFDEENFYRIFNYFSNADIKISNFDFTYVTDLVEEDDLVYFDPPYDVIENKNSFISYSKEKFYKKDQLRLFDTFEKLDQLKVKLILSNHATDFIIDIYKNYKINFVEAKRLINSNYKNRGNVKEVIITNYNIEHKKDE